MAIKMDTNRLVAAIPQILIGVAASAIATGTITVDAQTLAIIIAVQNALGAGTRLTNGKAPADQLKAPDA